MDSTVLSNLGRVVSLTAGIFLVLVLLLTFMTSNPLRVGQGAEKTAYVVGLAGVVIGLLALIAAGVQAMGGAHPGAGLLAVAGAMSLLALLSALWLALVPHSGSTQSTLLSVVMIVGTALLVAVSAWRLRSLN